MTDFAKIVRATNGQQVLFYLETDADEGNILHSIVTFAEYQAHTKWAGLPDEVFATVLDQADTQMADRVLYEAGKYFDPGTTP
jgi:hypothetical protein